MAELEKVLKGLECCHDLRGIDLCRYCPYDGDISKYHCQSKLMTDALELLKAQEPVEARLHLCESCANTYPDCDATADGIAYGCGTGNDNVIGCTAYVNRWKAQEAAEPEIEVLNEIDRIYRCPSCHKCFFYKKQRFCDSCGQAVKWE